MIYFNPFWCEDDLINIGTKESAIAQLPIRNVSIDAEYELPLYLYGCITWKVEAREADLEV